MKTLLLISLSLWVGLAFAGAQVIYIGPAEGDWDNAANWSTVTVPTADDDVLVDTREQDSAVTIGTSRTRTITNIDINAGDSVLVSNNSNFNINGPLLQIDGALQLNGAGNTTNLVIGNAAAVLSGSGGVVLGNSQNNRILGTGLLTNSATIEGRGQLGVNQLAIVNAVGGVIDANISAALNPGARLVVDPRSSGGLANQGTMQASNGGVLLLTGSGGGAFNNADGLIQAIGAGSEVQLVTNVAITGGTLHTEDGGLIRGNSSHNYFFTDVTFDSGTQVRGENNSDFGVSGTITNNGVITINSQGNATDIELQSDTALTGDGEVVLAGGSARINGSGILSNLENHTIRGQGNVGVNAIGVINNGTIRADVEGGSLAVDPSSAGNFDNNGVMEATGGGVLIVTGSGGGAFSNDAALIQAKGAGSEVQLTSNASITGGTLHTEDGGLIRGNASQNYFFTDVTFDNGTQVQGDNNSDFGVRGTITNNGVITMDSQGNATDIELQSDTALTGDGEVVLAGAQGNARINGSGILSNSANHTIRGQGNVGANAIGVINNGTIRADVDGGSLTVDPSSAGNFDNNGTMEATGGGVLVLTGIGGGTFSNDGALIQAKGAGSEVQLTSSVSITGGTLHTEDGGLIRGNASQNYFFTDVTFDNGTQVQGDNNSDFGVRGTITNNGAITINSQSNATDIELQSDTALTGDGEVVLAGAQGNARINGSGTLSNLGNHTIRGQGNVGVNAIGVFNGPDATIEADVDGGMLTLDPMNGAGTFDNRGLLAASNGGVLRFTGSGGGSFDNVNGTIRANEASEVQLISGASIDGGTLDSQGSGLFRVLASQSVAISNAAISADTVIENNATLNLGGNITHSGDMTVAAGGNFTDIVIGDLLDLDGGGAVSLVGSNGRIRGSGVFINRDHEISGAGHIGVNQAAMTNGAGGTFHANLDGGTMNIDPNSFLGFVNDGTLRASGGGRLNLSGNGGGEFTFGDSSVVEALDGGSITHSSSAFLTNLQNSVLTGGTYRAIDEGNGASMSLPGGNIATNAATIELSGPDVNFAQLGSLAQNDGSLSLAKGAKIETAAVFAQSASGSMDIHIDGKPEDTGFWGQFVGAAIASLDGTLNVFFNIGETFTAAVGDAWKVVQSAIREGEFASVNFTAEGLPDDSSLAVNYLDDGVEVAIVGAAPLKAVNFATWAAASLPDQMDRLPHADPDGDGATNLEEYAFGMDPTVSDVHLLPTMQLYSVDEESFLAISYARPTDAGARPDISYSIEYSVDLVTWTRGEEVYEPEISKGAFTHVTARCPDAIGTVSEMEFLRVIIELRDSED